MSDDEKPTKADRVDRKLTEIGSSLADLLQSIRARRMTLRQIRDELDAMRAQQRATSEVAESPPSVDAPATASTSEAPLPDSDSPADDE